MQNPLFGVKDGDPTFDTVPEISQCNRFLDKVPVNSIDRLLTVKSDKYPTNVLDLTLF